MVATVDVQEANGAGPSWNTITTARFNTDDVYNPGTTNPIVIPTAAFNFSFWKHHTLQFTATFTSIDNIRLYSDEAIAWTWGTGGELRIGARDAGDYGCPLGSYDQATGTVGTTGADLETDHTYYSGQTNKSDPISDYGSGSPVTIDSNAYTSVDDRCFYAVLQVKVDTAGNGATPGSQDPETLTWLYDEQ